jgi:hypothetical protein
MNGISEFITTILGQLPGFIFGVAATLLVAVGTGFIKEFFDERARKKKHKLEVARHVLRICNEASTGNFRHAPREMEDINSTLTDLEGVDKEMETIMNSFVNLWGRLVEASGKAGQGEAGQRHFIEMSNDIEEKRKALITWANRIRVGS